MLFFSLIDLIGLRLSKHQQIARYEMGMKASEMVAVIPKVETIQCC